MLLSGRRRRLPPPNVPITHAPELVHTKLEAIPWVSVPRFGEQPILNAFIGNVKPDPNEYLRLLHMFAVNDGVLSIWLFPDFPAID
jgi:hypothetical protein